MRFAYEWLNVMKVERQHVTCYINASNGQEKNKYLPTIGANHQQHSGANLWRRRAEARLRDSIQIKPGAL